MKSLYQGFFNLLKDYAFARVSYMLNYPLIKPWRVNFDITYRCPLKCKMCHIWKKKPKVSEELTLKELKNLIDQIAEWNIDHISFAGGETLVRAWDVVKLIEYASSKYSHMRTDLITNAHYLDEKLCKALFNAGVSKISLSLDAAKREIHDFIRVRGNYDKVLSSARLLTKLRNEMRKNVELEFTTVIMGYNFRELVDIFRLMQEIGFDYINYQVVVPDNTFINGISYFKKFYNSRFWIKDEEIGELRRICKELINLKKMTGRIRNTRDYLRLIPEYFKKKDKFRAGLCLAGFSYLNIDPYGNVNVCGFGPNLNVREKNIKELWNDRKYKRTRMLIKRCKRPCFMLCYERLDLRAFIRAWLELRGWLE